MTYENLLREISKIRRVKDKCQYASEWIARPENNCNFNQLNSHLTKIGRYHTSFGRLLSANKLSKEDHEYARKTFLKHWLKKENTLSYQELLKLFSLINQTPSLQISPYLKNNLILQLIFGRETNPTDQEFDDLMTTLERNNYFGNDNDYLIKVFTSFSINKNFSPHQLQAILAKVDPRKLPSHYILYFDENNILATPKIFQEIISRIDENTQQLFVNDLYSKRQGTLDLIMGWIKNSPNNLMAKRAISFCNYLNTSPTQTNQQAQQELVRIVAEKFEAQNLSFTEICELEAKSHSIGMRRVLILKWAEKPTNMHNIGVNELAYILSKAHVSDQTQLFNYWIQNSQIKFEVSNIEQLTSFINKINQSDSGFMALVILTWAKNPENIKKISIDELMHLARRLEGDESKNKLISIWIENTPIILDHNCLLTPLGRLLKPWIQSDPQTNLQKLSRKISNAKGFIQNFLMEQKTEKLKLHYLELAIKLKILDGYNDYKNILNFVTSLFKFVHLPEITEFCKNVYSADDTTKVVFLNTYIRNSIEAGDNYNSESAATLANFLESIEDDEAAFWFIDQVRDIFNLGTSSLIVLARNRTLAQYGTISEILSVRNIAESFTADGHAEVISLFGNVDDMTLMDLFCYYNIQDQGLTAFTNLLNDEVRKEISDNFRLSNNRTHATKEEFDKLRIFIPNLELPLVSDLTTYLRSKINMQKFSGKCEDFRINFEECFLETQQGEDADEHNHKTYNAKERQDLSQAYINLLKKNPQNPKQKDDEVLNFFIRLLKKEQDYFSLADADRISEFCEFFYKYKNEIAFILLQPEGIQTLEKIFFSIEDGCSKNITSKFNSSIIEFSIKYNSNISENEVVELLTLFQTYNDEIYSHEINAFHREGGKYYIGLSENSLDHPAIQRGHIFPTGFGNALGDKFQNAMAKFNYSLRKIQTEKNYSENDIDEIIASPEISDKVSSLAPYFVLKTLPSIFENRYAREFRITAKKTLREIDSMLEIPAQATAPTQSQEHSRLLYQNTSSTINFE